MTVLSPGSTRAEIAAVLALTDAAEIEAVRAQAEAVLLENCGDTVALRGLLEVSNYCCCNCLYCGIRRGNKTVERYTLEPGDALAVARACVEVGYGSLVLQSGERRDEPFVAMIENLVRRIKEETQSESLPQGLGVTLSVGEQTPETYSRFYEAGAHRYLLRIETTNPDLFARIHPPDQSFDARVACLESLRTVGFQVGTGVMIGLPGQSLDDLARDILFFKDHDIDMIGMGPFIPHENTPLGELACPDAATRVRLGLLMIAATRLVLRDVNIASTTALQALDPAARTAGLRFGANVIMPLMTPDTVRRNYQLYPGKPYLEESSSALHDELLAQIACAGRRAALGLWGDSPHALVKGRKGACPLENDVAEKAGTCRAEPVSSS